MAYAISDVGMHRRSNEDNFLLVDLSTASSWTADTDRPSDDLLIFEQGFYGTLAAVADGMGGALAGEVASSIAIHTFRDVMLEFQLDPSHLKGSPTERLRIALQQANDLIYQESISNQIYAGMGTTFTAAAIFGRELYLAQVGDSRAYLIRNNQIQPGGYGNPLVASLFRAGHISAIEAEDIASRSNSFQALGIGTSFKVEMVEMELRKEDVIVLCTDGLSNKVTMREIEKIVVGSSSLKDTCESLIYKANERGGEDNITVLVLQVSGSLPESDDEPTRVAC